MAINQLAVREGKIFETELHDAFRHLYTRYPVEWRRVIDTFTAGRIMDKADGDFELTVASKDSGRPYRFRIEAKASSEVTTLAKDFRSRIKAHQNAKMLMAERAGICGIFAFKSVLNEEIELWYCLPMCKFHPKKRVQFNGRPAFTFSLKNLTSFAEYWVKSPDEVLATFLRSKL